MAVIDFPPLTHVALTVRDLSVSVPWYEALLDAKPVLDEDTDPNFHHTVYLLANSTLLGLHQHARPAPSGNFSEFRVGLDHVAFGVADRAELRSGPVAWTSWASPTARSRTPAMARASASATRTASRSSSSPHPPDPPSTIQLRQPRAVAPATDMGRGGGWSPPPVSATSV